MVATLKTKVSAFTDDEIDAKAVYFGTSALPYPTSDFVLNENGTLDTQISVIHDDTNPLSILSDRSAEEVLGLVYRDMPVPSLLHIRQEAIMRRKPCSRNRLLAVFGDPGAGKSHEAKSFSKMRSDEPPIVIDCGGRYMGDLLFEQVIDFGEDFKTALNDRIASGSLSEKSITIFDEEFKGALIRDEKDHVVGIDWDVISKPVKVKGPGNKQVMETSAQAVSRAMRVIEDTVAKWESIPTHAVNNIGVRKQHGPLIKAFKEGREIILDEYTKSIEGSDDSLHTVLQF
jgi:hypothetical protein